MAKYGTFKYSEEMYGYTDPGRRLSWGLVIDWADTGTFISGYNEAYSYGENEHKMFALNTKAGRQYFINSNGNNFQNVDASRMQVQLYDMGGRYDPYNMDGPLYQHVLPGKKFRLIVRDEVNQVNYPIMVGRIDDIRPNFGIVSTVTITGVNGIDDLQNITVKTDQVYTSKTFDEAITKTLQQANWKDGMRIDSDISAQLPYWWLSGDTAFDELSDLTNSSRGLFFVSYDGYATYYSNINSMESVASYVDTDALLSYGIRIPTPWEAIKNYVRVYAKARRASTGTLWTLQSKPYIGAGSSITIWAEGASVNGDTVPALSVTTPVATTDYTANSSEDGSGTNITANISITMTNYATTQKLVISNTGGVNGYLTLMQLRGTSITSDEYTYYETNDTDSITTYKQRELVVKTNWIQSINDAEDYANTITSLLAEPKKFPRFVVRAKPQKQFAPDIFDIVSVDFQSKQLTGDFRVGYIEHNWVITNGDIVDTTFYLEPNTAGNISGTWVFPALFDLSTKF